VSHQNQYYGRPFPTGGRAFGAAGRPYRHGHRHGGQVSDRFQGHVRQVGTARVPRDPRRFR
jgi:hypothetical protein